jgi:hypothetical protein
MNPDQSAWVITLASASALCEIYGTLTVMRMYRETSRYALQVLNAVVNEEMTDGAVREHNPEIFRDEQTNPENAMWQIGELRAQSRRDRTALATPLVGKALYNWGFRAYVAGAVFGLLAVILAVAW